MIPISFNRILHGVAEIKPQIIIGGDFLSAGPIQLYAVELNHEGIFVTDFAGLSCDKSWRRLRVFSHVLSLEMSIGYICEPPVHRVHSEIEKNG